MPTAPQPNHRLHALRAIHHKNAAKAARLALIIHRASKSLLNLHAKMDKEARIAAGAHYKKEGHQIDFNKYDTLAEQSYRGEIPEGPGIVDILDTSRAIAAYARRVAAEANPPPLPSE
jgi:hypothetical protein